MRALSGAAFGAVDVQLEDAIPSGVFSTDALPSHLAMNAEGKFVLVWGITSS